LTPSDRNTVRRDELTGGSMADRQGDYSNLI
jgi:hypothetical protein